MTRQFPTHCVVGLLAVTLAGCATENRVLDPLPGPYHLDYGAVPSPIVPVAARPDPAETVSLSVLPESTPHAWLPAAGIDDRWTCIVVHHSDSETGSLRDIDTWHRQQGWEHGCGYHFVIGNGTNSGDGEVEVSHRWIDQVHGAHTRLSQAYARQRGVDFQHYNEHGIGIVLVGNFDEHRPSSAQIDALVRVLRFLTSRYGIPADRIYTHGEVDQTRCPGRLLDIGAIRAKIRAMESLSGGEEPSRSQTGT